MKKLAWAALVVVAACSSQSPKGTSEIKVETPKAAKVTLMYQSTRNGTIEPCGCHTNPFGGIDREANAIMMARQTGRPVIYVDAGNSLALKPLKGKLKFNLTKAEAITEMQNRMGLDVFSPGPAEYGLGVDALIGLYRKSTAKWVSTNVVNAEGATVFSPYVLIEKDGVTYAILSVTPKDALPAGGSYHTEDPEVALKKTLPQIPKDAFVVVLSQLSSDGSSKIALTNPEVRVVVGTDPNVTIETLARFRKWQTVYVDPGINGGYVGRLDLDLQLPFQAFSSTDIVKKNQEQIKKAQLDLQKNPKNLTAQKLLQQAENNLSEIPTGTNLSEVHHVLIRLDKERFGQPNPVTKMVNVYRKQVRQKAISE
jgi:2',3'-cyclic-nucleotide 2'-phosphodiesterase (5'-nucleotidase family)